ncbi:MAG: hypothetical protein HOP11_00135 [Saprospiraceae bacterium]|nr:hypothetical protein [Saprospiraceae bacterium]
MIHLIIGTILVSLLHALIPSHWIPLLGISKTYQWSKKETLTMSFYLACAHVFSTLIIGIMLGAIGIGLNEWFHDITLWLSPTLIIVFGIYFLWRHHTHHHFHVDDEITQPPVRKKQLFLSLMMFMILSPCIEITGFFFGASKYGWLSLLLISIIYTFCSILFMMLWVNFLWHGFQKIDSHKWEHNSGIITGWTIILAGILSFFIH